MNVFLIGKWYWHIERKYQFMQIILIRCR